MFSRLFNSRLWRNAKSCFTRQCKIKPAWCFSLKSRQRTLFVWAAIDTVLHVIYSCPHVFAISETTFYKLRLDFLAHQVIKSLLVTIIRQNLFSESEFQLHVGRNWSRCDIQKANSFMLIFVKRKALKICNSDVRKSKYETVQFLHWPSAYKMTSVNFRLENI